MFMHITSCLGSVAVIAIHRHFIRTMKGVCCYSFFARTRNAEVIVSVSLPLISIKLNTEVLH